MKIKRGVLEIAFDIFNTLILILFSIITIYPLLYVLFASFSDPNILVGSGGLLLYPLGFNIDSYIEVFKFPMVTRGYLNTINIVFISLVINITMTSFGAYALSRKDMPFMATVTKLIVFTMFFSGGLIPFFLVVRGVGLYNSIFSVIIPFSINTFNLIILKTAFEAMPQSIIESAQIDGANDFTILFRIVMPVSMATISVLILYYMVQHWNSWFHATLFISNRNLQPLQVFLREVLIQNTASASGSSMRLDKPQMSETIKYATVIVATLPLLVIYPFLQKFFTKGVMIGGVKG